MKTVLTGASGQLGRSLQEQLAGDIVCLTHQDIELSDSGSIRSVIRFHNPDLIINAAAYNAVDLAEEEPEKAFAVNALGPRILAEEAERNRAMLMHISTDYVFGRESDRKKPYRETDKPGPLSTYGVSKLSGEYFVASGCRKYFIVRTCGLYGPVQQIGTGNFVQTMLRLSQERSELKIVNDQHCTPTSTKHLAQALIALAQTEEYGLYHAVNEGSTTWYEFARTIFEIAKRNVNLIPISSAEYGAKAKRPLFSLLKCQKLQNATGNRCPHWKESLEEYLKASKFAS